MIGVKIVINCRIIAALVFIKVIELNLIIMSLFIQQFLNE